MHKRMDIPTAHIHRESEKHKLGWRIGFHLTGMRFHGNNPLNNEPVLFSVPEARSGETRLLAFSKMTRGKKGTCLKKKKNYK